MDLLDQALRLRPANKVALTFKCHPRTLHRRMIESGRVIARPPPRVGPRHTGSAVQMSDLTDGQLDMLVAEILQDYPEYGRSMLKGALRANGYRVFPLHLNESFNRVYGTPGVFGGRRLTRRRYRVPGANSLWHHDGQHGEKMYRAKVGTLLMEQQV